MGQSAGWIHKSESSDIFNQSVSFNYGLKKKKKPPKNYIQEFVGERGDLLGLTNRM